MNLFPPTVILRHRKENLKKCSLKGLETRPDFQFFSYPKGKLPSLIGYILLKPGAPCLTEKDANAGIFLIDGTWRLASIMEKQLPDPLEERSLPAHLRTAYPRCQTACPLPEEGLASIEALFAAYAILGRSTHALLDGYYWKEEFLRKNSF